MTFLKHMAALAAGLSMIALAGAASAEGFKLSREIAPAGTSFAPGTTRSTRRMARSWSSPSPTMPRR